MTASPDSALLHAELEASAAALVSGQQPHWPDAGAVRTAVETLAAYPPLVFAGECDVLRDRMAAAARGEAFVLQGGDCAETFAAATADNIRDRIKTILQMAAVLTYGASVPVVKIGRMGGQYAKPRSTGTETRDGVELPAYRGDMVNDFAFTPETRTPDPNRLVRAYHASSATLNLVRAFTMGGFADLRHVHDWNKGFVANPANQRYDKIAHDIDMAMKFMAACGAEFERMKTVEFFAAHEALILDYERPLTRIDSRTGLAYDTSAHFVWVGERTRDLDGAHVDFVSRIQNPVGVKVSANAEPDQLLKLLDRIDPDRVPGRVSFITRMGARTVREALPPIVERVTESGALVTWICDPMHGNTFSSTTGYKTRHFDDVVDEVHGFFDVHRALGTVPGGIHVELTGNDVTECLGGSEKILDADLEKRYESLCDPRLNHQQSLELAFLVAEMLGGVTLRADLLSDTLTRPTEGMRAAMAAAEVGDDVFGEDPTVNALEEEVADLLGHEAGLFTPSGSMANQLGLRLHVAPGQELVCDSLAHVVRAELGAAAVFSGISSRTWVAPRGLLSAADPLALMITGAGAYQVNTALVVVENTHNFGGGTVQPIDEIRLLRKGTAERGVRMHLDGARLWNAHVASGVALADYGREFDTVSVCLSKGLGAPVGSVLVGSSDAMAEARIWRKRYGGGMRQVGILAAAGRYALTHHLERLADDHARARRAAEAFATAAPGCLDPGLVETNILVMDVSVVGRTGADFAAAASAEGVRLYAVGPGAVRLVWHLDVSDAATDAAISVVTGLLRSAPA